MTRSRSSRMSSIPRCEAASISITSSEVPLAIATQAWQTLSGVGVGPCAQFSPFARIRASDVLPVPRGPAKRYAWRTCPEAIAFFSVRTTASCPTTSSKSWGRYFRYSAVEWSRAFGGVPVYVHADDREWIMRPDPCWEFWQGEELDLGKGL